MRGLHVGLKMEVASLDYFSINTSSFQVSSSSFIQFELTLVEPTSGSTNHGKLKDLDELHLYARLSFHHIILILDL